MNSKNPDTYKNKYRIASTRLQSWDYSWPGLYFITISTANREKYFGDIVDGEMLLSEIGNIAQNEWLKTFSLRPDMNIKTGEFVVMPNHFHAIIFIGKNRYNTKNNDYNRRRRGYAMHRRDAMHRVSTTTTNNRVSTTNRTPINTDKPTPKNKFGPQRKNLSLIVRGFKSAITTYARKNNIEFAWQSNYHDHITRNEDELRRIGEYIINNPKKWVFDKHNKP